MTYDEWKKARVEAGSNAIAEINGEGSVWQRAQFILGRVDAVPLPGKEEVIVEAISALISRENVNSQDAIRYAWAVIDALRPWIATMIEKGK